MATANPTDSLPAVDGVGFRLVPGWPAYAAGTDGSVWTRRVHGSRAGRLSATWRRMRPMRHKGYLYVNLCDKGSKRQVSVHHVVLETFIGPCPECQECRHLDGTPSNNALANLCWGTRHENARDTVRHGRSPLPQDRRGEGNGHHKLTGAEVREIRRLKAEGKLSTPAIAKLFGISRTHARFIIIGEAWPHL